MNIQLESSKVLELAFNILTKDAEPRRNSYSLRTGQSFPEEDKHQFLIIFEVTISDMEFDLSFKSEFLFRTEDEIDENFKVSDFPKVNAPAIAFPYIRAYISNFTLQSGFKPVMLPSINFVRANRQ